ncbi:hypothetical protein AVEN_58182-1 [Araneus ventricosus]|uniref:Uncharacterized protein n=1 Tax=Araneus ventricosus TaxID=182803 RepID=A0A4Y2SET8_ARAVE|nr:hypothetical protein AVEN_58182-1 [Araneus ventricosus]
MEVMNRSDKSHIFVHKGQLIYVMGKDFTMSDDIFLEIPCPLIQTYIYLGWTMKSVAAASIGNTIYFLCESLLTNVMTVEEYGSISETFSSLPTPEGSRRESAMTAYDDQLFVIVGSSGF